MINYVAHFLYEKCDTYHGVKNDNIKNKSMRLFLPLIDIFIPSYVFMKNIKSYLQCHWETKYRNHLFIFISDNNSKYDENMVQFVMCGKFHFKVRIYQL